MAACLWRYFVLHLCLLKARSLNFPSARTIRQRLPSTCSSTSLNASREKVTSPKEPSIKLDDTITSGYSVSLYSLQWTPDEKISMPVRKTWRWKDAVLGDGRDFFVPKPKTIQMLQRIFLDNVPGLEECSVLSNCARFEVLCAWGDTNDPTDSERERRLEVLSACLMQQVEYHDKNKNQLLATLTQSLDRPNLLTSEIMSESKDEFQELSRHWDSIHDTSAILFHLGNVSAGSSPRPRRPDRTVFFRPYSSRDAHILLQLKRTKDVVSSKRGVLNELLEFSLRAGKAARNEKIVPALKQLQPYSSIDPPLDLSIEVQEKVIEIAIEPLVRECLEKLNASTLKDSIATFRQAAESLSTSDEELAIIRKLLHHPTILLRRSPETVDVQQTLNEIDAKLRQLRQSDSSLL